ncbi:MAG: DUF465 domain-containing protein [Betaproteobacteria bacterium]|nr:MAG: DUF465 domain-containing protein [Betaproteobacteria bacterium]
MFPEYEEQMIRLKNADAQFADLCERHHRLDQAIHDIEAHTVPATYEHLEDLKKQKLQVKDQVYAALRRAGAV